MGPGKGKGGIFGIRLLVSIDNRLLEGESSADRRDFDVDELNVVSCIIGNQIRVFEGVVGFRAGSISFNESFDIGDGGTNGFRDVAHRSDIDSD